MARVKIGSSMSPGWVSEGVQWIHGVGLVDPCVGVVGVASSCSERGLPGPCEPRGLMELALVLVHSDLIMCAARTEM